MSSRWPWVPAKMIAICRSITCGWYCPCLSSSTMRWPRASWSWVARSRSEPNWAKAASSRYWARSRRSLPATCRIALICAEPPTRETEMPDVDRGADARVEQVRLQVDLAVGDRDDVGRDVGRHVAELRLDDRQRGERAAAQLVVQLRRALEQPRVEIEHVARIRLAARRPPQQQRELAVRGRRAWRGRRRCRARGGRSRGSTRPSRSPRRARCTAAAPDRTRRPTTTVV